jgi:exopolysaccharide biosynthesis WecB/TagA/CpsF family protein
MVKQVPELVPDAVEIGGLPIIPLDRDGWVLHVLELARRRKELQSAPAIIMDANANVMSWAARSDEFRAMMIAADGLHADGMPLVFASRFLRRHLPGRVSGADFYHDVARRAVDAGASFFLLGGSAEVNDAAVRRTRELYPELAIAGHHHGYFEHHGLEAVLGDIRAARPDVLWVGLGVPREQQFAFEHRAACTGAGVIKTCGATFDYLAGKVPRAPAWMRSSGTEWLFRLAVEPRRLFWRYALTNPHALFLMLTRSRSTWTPR